MVDVNLRVHLPVGGHTEYYVVPREWVRLASAAAACASRSMSRSARFTLSAPLPRIITEGR